VFSVDGVLCLVAECLQFADGEKRRAAAEAATAAIRSKFNEQVMPPHSATALLPRSRAAADEDPRVIRQRHAGRRPRSEDVRRRPLLAASSRR
jgi:hypothetical protein